MTHSDDDRDPTRPSPPSTHGPRSGHPEQATAEGSATHAKPRRSIRRRARATRWLYPLSLLAGIVVAIVLVMRFCRDIEPHPQADYSPCTSAALTHHLAHLKLQVDRSLAVAEIEEETEAYAASYDCDLDQLKAQPTREPIADIARSDPCEYASIRYQQIIAAPGISTPEEVTAAPALWNECIQNNRAELKEITQQPDFSSTKVIELKIELADNFASKANLLYFEGRYASALEAYLEALTYLEPADDPQLWASIQHDIGAAYRRIAMERRDEGVTYGKQSLHHYEQGLKTISKSLDPVLWVDIQHGKCASAWFLGRLYLPGNQAVELLKNAERLCREALGHSTPDTPGAASIETTLGNVLLDQAGTLAGPEASSRLDAAIERYLSSLDVAETQIARSNLGLAYMERARSSSPREAERHLENAIECFTRVILEYPQEVASYEATLVGALLNRGAAYVTRAALSFSRPERKGLIAKAIEDYQRALSTTPTEDHFDDWILIQSNLTEAYLLIGETAMCLEHSSKALDYTEYRKGYRSFSILLQAYRTACHIAVGDDHAACSSLASLIERIREQEGYFRIPGSLSNCLAVLDARSDEVPSREELLLLFRALETEDKKKALKNLQELADQCEPDAGSEKT